MQEYWDAAALGTPLQHIKYKKISIGQDRNEVDEESLF